MSDTDSNSDQEDWKCDPADLMWEPPCSLRLSYWKRNAETQQAKDDHVDYLETLPFSREELILKTTLRDADIAIEKNMFPYATPPNIEVIIYTISDLQIYFVFCVLIKQAMNEF